MRTSLSFLLGFLVWVGSLHGQTHDLGVEVVIHPPGITPIASNGHLTFTVTNHGPDVAGTAGPFRIFVSGDLLELSLLHGPLIIYDPVPGSPCLLTRNDVDPPPGVSPKVLYSLRFAEMAPGDVRVCEIDFTINPFAQEIDPVDLCPMHQGSTYLWT